MWYMYIMVQWLQPSSLFLKNDDNDASLMFSLKFQLDAFLRGSGMISQHWFMYYVMAWCQLGHQAIAWTNDDLRPSNVVEPVVRADL